MMLTQPLRGLFALGIAVGAAALFISLFPFASFLGQVSVFMITMTPALVLFDFVLADQVPPGLDRAPQPLRGLAKVLMAALVGVAPFFFVLDQTGSALAAVLPSSNFFIIGAVPIALWMVVIFGCWPWSALFKHPLPISLGVLISVFAATTLVYWTMYDLSFMAGAPFYNPDTFASGLFPANDALTFIIATATMIMGLAAFDFWPTATLAGQFTKPETKAFALVKAIADTVWILGGAAVLHYGFVVAGGMDIVAYQVQVPVSSLFGLFIMLLIFETWPFQTVAQPLKGILIWIAAAILGQVMFTLYGMALPFFASESEITSQPAGHLLWTASAMLGVTFPFIVIYCNLVGRWPLKAGE